MGIQKVTSIQYNLGLFTPTKLDISPAQVMENHQSLDHDEILLFNKLLTVDHYAFCVCYCFGLHDSVVCIVFQSGNTAKHTIHPDQN